MSLSKVVKKPAKAKSPESAPAAKAPFRDPKAPTFRPLSDRVIMRIDEPATVSGGGILLPDSAKEKPCKGTIIAVGPGALDPKTGQRDMGELEPGDRVLHGRYAGWEIPGHDGYRILRFEDILCKQVDA